VPGRDIGESVQYSCAAGWQGCEDDIVFVAYTRHGWIRTRRGGRRPTERKSTSIRLKGADEDQGDEIRHKFNLVLTDDPAFSHSQDVTNDVVDMLERWRQHIVDLVVFPRVFTIMSQAAVHV
jgi:hypothetical protein